LQSPAQIHTAAIPSAISPMKSNQLPEEHYPVTKTRAVGVSAAVPSSRFRKARSISGLPLSPAPSPQGFNLCRFPFRFLSLPNTLERTYLPSCLSGSAV
jgi:hypothetical protein